MARPTNVSDACVPGGENLPSEAATLPNRATRRRVLSRMDSPCASRRQRKSLFAPFWSVDVLTALPAWCAGHSSRGARNRDRPAYAKDLKFFRITVAHSRSSELLQ